MSTSATHTANPDWDKIIGDRSEEDIAKETAIKFDLNKKDSNVYQRLVYIQSLFANKPNTESVTEDTKDDDVHFYKPIDDVLEITRGESKPLNDTVGMYSLSSMADFSLDCNFTLKGSGKYYYEVELIEDPQKYGDISIGYANDEHSARNEVGFDGGSYGYNGVKNKVYHMDTSYGSTKWKAGDVLGLKIQIDDDKNTKFELLLNGESQGVVFEGDEIEYAGNGLFASFSLYDGECGVLVVDEDKLKSKPEGYECLVIDDQANNEDVWKLNGEIAVEKVENGYQIKANKEFPTAVVKGCEMMAGHKYYFEYVMVTDKCQQIGVSDGEMAADADKSRGVGDDEHGWSVDLNRLKRWGTWSKNYCNADWKQKDVIGCSLDLDEKTISYSVNGKDLGVAFENVNISRGLYPAVTVRDIGRRELLMMIYDKMRQKQSGNNQEEEEFVMPEICNYFNLIFAENGLKYKPDGHQAMTQNIVFKAQSICDSLRNYSYKQYMADYKFMDTVIMLDKDEEFDEIVKAVDNDTLIVCDFWATWCGPCIRIAPFYHELSEKYKDVVFLKADVDELKKLSQEKGIQCMPTFKFFKGGEEVHKVEGGDIRAIIAGIEKYSK